MLSPETNKEILDLGLKHSTDEMCLSLKNYIGHVAYLKDKCDYILIPRIDNYGIDNQTCTNFLAIYDIINNAPKKLATSIKIGADISQEEAYTEYEEDLFYCCCSGSHDSI